MVLAFVLVNCIMEQSESVERAVRKVAGVTDVYSTTGIYDVIARAEGKDESKLGNVIRKIKSISGVTATLTSIVYNDPSKDDVEAAGSDNAVTILSYNKPINDDGDWSGNGIMLRQR
jgi:DNA-binding Lrp family transcriptional regulator